MSESQKSLYISNAWESLVTDTARRYMENAGWTVDGNWLNNKNISPLYKVILAAPAHFDGALVAYPKDFPSSKVFAHLLYPDEVVGWDFGSNNYKRKSQEYFTQLLQGVPILSHSQFTLELVASTYGYLNQDRSITYLPVEFDNIQKTKKEATKDLNKPTRVLWNHMWRSDKGIVEALAAIDELSLSYERVEFFVGRQDSWGENPDVAVVKNKCKDLLNALRNRKNVYFHQGFRSSTLTEYWKFLSQFDVGFSLSHQEGFGLSMLEQASAGIACVMPRREAYPEIHAGGLITENVVGGIAELIENSEKRKEISQSCQDNANRFNAQDWAKTILQKIS